MKSVFSDSITGHDTSSWLYDLDASLDYTPFLMMVDYVGPSGGKSPGDSGRRPTELSLQILHLAFLPANVPLVDVRVFAATFTFRTPRPS